jgi:phosphatidylserine/phosphatidylglycerophosphate/cardiolipin synthase-like enzyme
MIRVFLVTILLISSLWSVDKLYFMPKDGKDARKDIITLIKNTKSSIDIAMYNFKDRKIAKALDGAANNGVKIKLFYYKKKIKFSDKINDIKIREKLHTKLAIIDKQIVIFGSANWVKEAFKENHEVIYITDSKDLVKKFNKYFSSIRR